MRFLRCWRTFCRRRSPSDVAIGGVAPNFAIAIIAVVSIALGRKYTFMMSLAVGYLMEIMMPSLDYIYLILYPVCAMLGALAFSDKSERRMEEERTTTRKTCACPRTSARCFARF